MNRKSGTDHGFPLCEDQIIELWLHRLLHRFAWPPRLPSAVGPKPPKNRGLSPIIILIKYNQKTVTLITDSGQRWNVAPALLSKIKPVSASAKEGVVIEFDGKKK
jgi:hypothetical protein